ncbi:uncharacterized protein TrAtP1_007820 [Trichoderma atroviride]|uniref:uncharacterized protein n=1 Tax=Hypocrea atroviridis TaxID=63577 RepID=UPI003328C927|nr:hypothetical protein TrAtP1_007820 [Trichoderma atroviride]
MLLSLLLLQSMDAQDGRVLFVSSWSHDIDDPRNDVMMGAYKDTGYPTLFPGAEVLAKGQWSRPEDDPGINSGFRRYGASKLCAMMLCEELADRIAKDPKLNNISVVSLSPGTMPTSFGRRAGFLIGVVATRVIMPVLSEMSVRFSPNGMLRPSWKSAADVIRACFDIEAYKGEALHLDGTASLQIAKDAKDEAKRKELWEYGLGAAKMDEGDTALVEWT